MASRLNIVEKYYSSWRISLFFSTPVGDDFLYPNLNVSIVAVGFNIIKVTLKWIVSGALEEDEGKERESLSSKQKHILKHRELFLSRQVETLPATQIRGKCSVTLLNETESLLSYINKEARNNI